MRSPSTELFLESTSKFSVFSNKLTKQQSYIVEVCLNCDYTSSLVKNAVMRRSNCYYTDNVSNADASTSSSSSTLVSWLKTIGVKSIFCIQVSDFECINWDVVLQRSVSEDKSSTRALHGASSYLVRKGLSRKAQLSLQLRKYICKNPSSILSNSVPFTVIVETWNAFEDMKLDLGRGAIFSGLDCPDLMRAPLRQKLEWSLSDVRDTVEDAAHADWKWIIKPSVTNKGADISVVGGNCWHEVLNVLENSPDIREWVMQRYIPDPLLIGGHKFHLRVYVVCVGAMRVFVCNHILMLLAAHKYDYDDLDDIYKHLTNTARAAEDVDFDEKLFVKLLEDLPSILCQEYPNLAGDMPTALALVQNIKSQVYSVTAELFNAFESEYSIFCPMTNCFEVFGLDFLVNSDCQGVQLLEVNPGPDFKQTGQRLQRVIADLWEHILRVVVDLEVLLDSCADTNEEDEEGGRRKDSKENGHSVVVGAADDIDTRIDERIRGAERDGYLPSLTMVYSKRWSVASIQGGMSFTTG